MKNTVPDVRNHLVAMMETLGDPDCKPEVVERARALSGLVKEYTETVKVEMAARKLVAELGPDMKLPPALEHRSNG